ncbi:PA0069 family radical SAM protein [Pseudoruegeria sp. SHC-113]|uniref:PA0069 family radical SAM protein n=1 Tax=Pseudoruegeria sp. SHC-113 TaxID=2855439 RepID=UPI0021BA7BDA|nr:PA0069 family radical SAM protein [Pseudoruegeria sp. SHC-113]MCT8160331.1 PA0069 family radical SAM protein [Pseudoruegeria sp. SHC-113]
MESRQRNSTEREAQAFAGRQARGRGAASNETGRYERFQHTLEPDGWDITEEPRVLRTQVSEERPRSVITYNSSPDLPFDRSINPYRGCEHGCIYCFARPTHAYLGLSPGLDFETRLVARPDAPAVLERELRRKGYACAPVAIGTNTDPYQPIEAERGIMRRILEVLQAFNHPVGVVTKGSLVERDADVLGAMGQAGLARVGISITTLDAGLSRRMEPRAPAPARRLAMIRKLAETGCEVRVMVAPLIPGLTDHELEAILDAAREAGAAAASFIMLRLPLEVAPLWEAWLHEHVPNRAEKILRRLREMHGGAVYDARFGHRMRGEGLHAELTQARFRAACKRLGLAERLPPLRSDLFAAPPRAGDQLSLF